MAGSPEEPARYRVAVAKTKDAGYSGTPLPKKLGIKPGTTVLLVGAPRGWEPTLGELPEDVHVKRGSIAKADMILWFASSAKELRAGMRKTAPARKPVDGVELLAVTSLRGR